MPFRIPLLTTAVGAAIALSALAGDDHDSGYREHGAHVHGISELNVAVDGATLLIELHGPADNILGFEHPPRDADEQQAVADARAKLADPSMTFLPNPEAGCVLAAHEVFMELAGDEGPERGHDHDHDHGGDVHSDAGASYSFDCVAPERLQSLDLVLFRTFPGTERLHLQLITPKGQSAAELTADDRSLAL